METVVHWCYNQKKERTLFPRSLFLTNELIEYLRSVRKATTCIPSSSYSRILRFGICKMFTYKIMPDLLRASVQESDHASR